jgi:hypothetical protein
MLLNAVLDVFALIGFFVLVGTLYRVPTLFRKLSKSSGGEWRRDIIYDQIGELLLDFLSFLESLLTFVTLYNALGTCMRHMLPCMHVPI